MKRKYTKTRGTPSRGTHKQRYWVSYLRNCLFKLRGRQRPPLTFRLVLRAARPLTVAIRGLLFTTNRMRGHRAFARLARVPSPPGLKATPSPASPPLSPPPPRGGMRGALRPATPSLRDLPSEARCASAAHRASVTKTRVPRDTKTCQPPVEARKGKAVFSTAQGTSGKRRRNASPNLRMTGCSPED